MGRFLSCGAFFTMHHNRMKNRIDIQRCLLWRAVQCDSAILVIVRKLFIHGRIHRMKKGVTTGLAALIASTTLTPVAFADDHSSDVKEDQQAPDSSSDESEETGEESVELIDTLTLDAAVEHALTDNTSLMLLQYRLDNLKSQLDATEDDHRDLENDIDDLEDDFDDLKEQPGNTFQPRYQIHNQIKKMENSLDQLEDAFEELTSNQVTLEFNQQEAEENIKFKTISTFMNLVMTKDQLAFTKDSLETQRKQVKATKRRYDLGLASRTEFRTDQRELTRLESQIKQTETTLENNLREFAADIGIVYHDDLSLEAPETDSVEPIEQEETTEELINNSYSMKTAKEELELAKYKLEQAKENINDTEKDVDAKDIEQAEINVDQKKENITQLKEDLKKAIDSLFTDAANQYQTVMDKRYELDYAKEDHQNLKRRLDVGLVSQLEYDVARTQVEQAELDYTAAKQQYFLLKHQVDLLRNGVIQTGGSSQQASMK
ncbi:TolC family protein [Lentibacillus cibarius]|uniref:TolC family protein n=2 Tax=Lentibacillus cibarius TaxID=2583219 RepID=A0A549YFJ5_9BACI|nr:TolC family protein [Lentibacillus cibarius]